MKYRCCITVLIVIAMIVVLSFSGYFMFEITSVLKSKSENFSSNMPIGMICSYQNTSSPVCLLNLESKSQDESIIKAYDSLCNELSSWMSIMGIFSVVFGLLIPIGSYLLQRNSIIEEKREIERKNKEDIIKVKRKIEEKTESILRPMWRFLAAQYHWNLMKAAKEIKIVNDEGSQIDAANFIIGFDHFINCVCKSANVIMMYETVDSFRPTIDKIRKRQEFWMSVKGRLKSKISCDNRNFVKGSEIERIIGCNSERFIWLKGFYNEIIPWKFDS